VFLGGVVVSLGSKVDNRQQVKHEPLYSTFCFLVRNWKFWYLGLEN